MPGTSINSHRSRKRGGTGARTSPTFLPEIPYFCAIAKAGESGKPGS